MRKIHWITIVIILLIPISGILFYPYMPEKMGTHWQFSKTPDGYMDKFSGTFVTALICIASPAFLLFINIAVSVLADKNKSKSIALFFMDYFTLILSLFLAGSYIAVLIWNCGVDFSVPIFMSTGVAVLIISILMLIISLMRQQQKSESSAITENINFSDGKYKDSLIEISGNNMIFKDYYFPMGSKKVNLSQVDYVKALKPTVWNGKWRMHGTGDLLFRIWFPADYNRPNRDMIFILKIKNKWTKVGFTVENSKAVSVFFKTKGLLRQNN
ncbi:MAG: DUF1648 domain-containing protein [Planctomycetaceae bacterium]|nr:DUF1648 domain-containing protein [Planctomycetaceae bacterium]